MSGLGPLFNYDAVHAAADATGKPRPTEGLEAKKPEDTQPTRSSGPITGKPK